MTKCRLCGDRVCKSKAMFYTGDLKDLCVRCRKKELDKRMEEKK